MNIATTMIKVLIANLLKMILSKKVIIWGLKLAAKQTSNTIDDNVINVIESAYEADVDKFQKSVEDLLESIKESKK